MERQYTKNKTDKDLFSDMTIIIDSTLVAQPVCLYVLFTSPTNRAENVFCDLFTILSLPCYSIYVLFPRTNISTAQPYDQGRGKLKDSIQELGVNVVVQAQSIPHTITWRRRTSDCDLDRLRDSGACAHDEIPHGVMSEQVWSLPFGGLWWFINCLLLRGVGGR